QYDDKVAQPTLADEDQQRLETEAVLAELKAAAAQPQQQEVAEDLQILIRRVELNFKPQDYARAHEVPFLTPRSMVFGSLHALVAAQSAAARRPAAVVR